MPDPHSPHVSLQEAVPHADHVPPTGHAVVVKAGDIVVVVVVATAGAAAACVVFKTHWNVLSTSWRVYPEQHNALGKVQTEDPHAPWLRVAEPLKSFL
jgi:hypothetical protein